MIAKQEQSDKKGYRKGEDNKKSLSAGVGQQELFYLRKAFWHSNSFSHVAWHHIAPILSQIRGLKQYIIGHPEIGDYHHFHRRVLCHPLIRAWDRAPALCSALLDY
jgi:hypothetical protein